MTSLDSDILFALTTALSAWCFCQPRAIDAVFKTHKLYRGKSTRRISEPFSYIGLDSLWRYNGVDLHRYHQSTCCITSSTVSIGALKELKAELATFTATFLELLEEMYRIWGNGCECNFDLNERSARFVREILMLSTSVGTGAIIMPGMPKL